jgi:hypothetical protein
MFAVCIGKFRLLKACIHLPVYLRAHFNWQLFVQNMIERTAYISRRLVNIILKVYVIIVSFLLTDRLTPRRKWQVMGLSDFQPRNMDESAASFSVQSTM